MIVTTQGVKDFRYAILCEDGGYVACPEGMPGYIAEGETADEALAELDRCLRHLRAERGEAGP